MTTKEFLQQALYIREAISDKKLELERLRSLAERTTSTISADPVSCGGSGGRVETYALMLDGLSDEIEEDKKSLEKAKDEIWEQIQTLSKEDERRVLHLKYLDFAEWKPICKDMQCCRTTANNIHDRAVASLAQILQNT